VINVLTHGARYSRGVLQRSGSRARMRRRHRPHQEGLKWDVLTAESLRSKIFFSFWDAEAVGLLQARTTGTTIVDERRHERLPSARPR